MKAYYISPNAQKTFWIVTIVLVKELNNEAWYRVLEFVDSRKGETKRKLGTLKLHSDWIREFNPLTTSEKRASEETRNKRVEQNKEENNVDCVTIVHL